MAIRYCPPPSFLFKKQTSQTIVSTFVTGCNRRKAPIQLDPIGTPSLDNWIPCVLKSHDDGC
jgi:hypothetical protein